MMSNTIRTPPNQLTTRSESDITKLYAEKDEASNNDNDTPKINITQRAKRRCPTSEEKNDDSLAAFKNEIRDMILNLMSSQNSRMDQLENHIIQIKNSNSKIEETNSGIEKSMSSVTEQLTSLETKITGLEQQRNDMAIKLTALEEKMESYDRSIIKTCVELRNIPKRPNETKNMLFDALLELSKYLQINLQLSDIRDVLRQPSKKESANSTVTVEFTNTLVKSNFLSAVKEYNKQNSNDKLNSTHLGIKAPKTPSYIAEQLTSSSKRLFYLARNYAKTNQYLYCWTSNGRVMLKKDADSQTIVIKTELQLKQISSLNNA